MTLASLLAGSNLYFGHRIGWVKVGRSGTSEQTTACRTSSLFSEQKVKSRPPADGVSDWSSRFQKNSDELFDYQSWSRKRNHRCEATSKYLALSFLIFERKNDYFEARRGNRCDKSAKGRRYSSSFPNRLWKKHVSTIFALSARELNRPVSSRRSINLKTPDILWTYFS